MRPLVDITSPILQAFNAAYERTQQQQQRQFDNELKTKQMQEQEKWRTEQVRQFDERMKQLREEEKRREAADKSAEEYRKFQMQMAVREGIKSGTVKPREIPQVQPQTFENINQLAEGNPAVPKTPIVDDVEVMGQRVPREELPDYTAAEEKMQLEQLRTEGDIAQATATANAATERAREIQKRREEHSLRLEAIRSKNREREIRLRAALRPVKETSMLEAAQETDLLNNVILGKVNIAPLQRPKYAKSLAEYPWLDTDGKVIGRGAVELTDKTGKLLQELAPGIEMLDYANKFAEAVEKGDLADIDIYRSLISSRVATVRNLTGQQAYGVLNAPEVARLIEGLPSMGDIAKDKLFGTKRIQTKVNELNKIFKKQISTLLGHVPSVYQKQYIIDKYNLRTEKDIAEMEKIMKGGK